MPGLIATKIAVNIHYNDRNYFKLIRNIERDMMLSFRKVHYT